MGTTGIVRKIDDLGRVVIPIEIRKKLGIKEGYLLEIFTDRDEIILRKYDASMGLCELVKRLEDVFSDVKKDMDINRADRISEHISALKNILKNYNETESKS